MKDQFYLLRSGLGNKAKALLQPQPFISLWFLVAMSLCAGSKIYDWDVRENEEEEVSHGSPVQHFIRVLH